MDNATNNHVGRREMKLPRMTLLAVSAIAVAFTSASSAGTKKEVDCSPGYWRNHQSVWIPESCGELDCDGLLEFLYSTGRNSGTKKNLAADIINGWATDNDITANCT
jgi:hypothetical protein